MGRSGRAAGARELRGGLLAEIAASRESHLGE